MNSVLPLIGAWCLAAATAYAMLSRVRTDRQARQRAFDRETAGRAPRAAVPERFLARWIFLAGFRSPSAVWIFLAATGLLLAVGGSLAWLLDRQGAMDLMERFLYEIPGGVGEIFLPVVWLSPWLITGAIGLGPTLLVRSRRRKRVEQIERDLPITLDLLATLAEAGLGFDSAIDRILMTQPSVRPLTRELRTFQRDVMAGRPRIDSLQRLSRRVEVTWFTIFVSAVIQAERLGAGLAHVLRVQADDLRSRRRERALAFAMSLQSKLVFPLVVCFLPGIAVVVLGPTFHQIFQILDGLLQRGAP